MKEPKQKSANFSLKVVLSCIMCISILFLIVLLRADLEIGLRVLTSILLIVMILFSGGVLAYIMVRERR